MSVALADEVEAERAYWDAAARGDGRWELFSVPGIEGWDAGVEACLEQIIPALTPVLHLGAAILDLGCGIGRLTLPLAAAFPVANFIGLDLSPKMVTTARTSAKRHGQRNVRFLTSDGRTLPKSVPWLAGAFSVLTFQHIPAEAQEGYIKALGARMEPEGVLRLQFVTTEVDHFLSHGVSPDVMAEWCVAAGLTVEALDLGVVDESWAWITARKL